MSTATLSVVAVSNDALRPELLDRLLIDDNNYNVIVVESLNERIPGSPWCNQMSSSSS